MDESQFPRQAMELRCILADALRRIDIGVILLDADMRVRFVNAKLAALFGSPCADALTGLTFRDLLSRAFAGSNVAGTDQRLTAYIEEQVQSARAGDGPPARINLRDGVALLRGCTPLPNGGRVLTFTDISDALRREVQEAVKLASADLRYANEMYEHQAADMASLAETSHENAHAAEQACKQLEQEIAQRQQLESELRRLATIDGLTGALNRTAFLAATEQRLRQPRAGGPGLAVLMLDVDHFKAINDRFGHAGGDAALSHLVTTLRAGLRATDLIGRLGGEEFCVFLQGVTPDFAGQVAARLLRAVARSPARHDDRSIAITVSIGLVTAPGAGDAVERLIARADEALYQAKHGGRDRVVRYDANGTTHVITSDFEMT